MNELEFLAAGVHGATATIHAAAAQFGELPRELKATVATLHVLGIVHHLVHRNAADVAAHVMGIVAAYSHSTLAHACSAVYDGAATIKHARRIAS